VNSYTGALSEREGEPYAAVNRSRIDGAQTVDVLEEVQSGSLDAVLSEAEVIIVSVGANDLPPYREGDCSDAAIDLHDVESAAVALAATTEECIATHTAAAGANLASLLESVREVAPDASILALTAYNAWTGWPLLDALGPAVAGPVSQVVVASTDAWRAEVCEKAEDVGGECVDLLAAFNGADGLTPAGDLLAADYGHPSQEGHDLIRDLLLEH
jgi:lysophospholipase L1-like esterase